MLNRYLHRLYDTIISRGYVEIERLDFDELPGRQGIIEGRLRFHDGSLLDFDEVVLLRSEQIVKLRYAYHYQNESGEVIFRYDNASHYPNIITYPHHKHVGSAVESAQVPDPSGVLREIEQMIFNGD
ncbi:MAG: DUF6516 family protein [Chloroflexi bacterium]|nr:DUF6516 family protein [Chloroflexota bacterium]